ncbi:hypothetical protein SAMN04487967_0249 [Natronorubrum sediminis]|uniref:Uncharacterized protein n=1 Tax=Natronorubrum sediminis TaxID=640943 RepID=A0A1H6FLG0_9EURY|nr:hypothetical protein [Natronorubrum sediminis]SEH11212.1 hypothetical protein SAMN04487967_0249 [Natronorubrum sediminis]
MDEQAISRSIPRSVGLLGSLSIAALAVVGLLGAVDGYLLESSEYLAPTAGVLVVTALVVGGLIALGARSKQWRAGPYW